MLVLAVYIFSFTYEKEGKENAASSKIMQVNIGTKFVDLNAIEPL